MVQCTVWRASQTGTKPCMVRITGYHCHYRLQNFIQVLLRPYILWLLGGRHWSGGWAGAFRAASRNDQDLRRPRRIDCARPRLRQTHQSTAPHSQLLVIKLPQAAFAPCYALATVGPGLLIPCAPARFVCWRGRAPMTAHWKISGADCTTYAGLEEEINLAAGFKWEVWSGLWAPGMRHETQSSYIAFIPTSSRYSPTAAGISTRSAFQRAAGFLSRPQVTHHVRLRRTFAVRCLLLQRFRSGPDDPSW